MATFLGSALVSVRTQSSTRDVHWYASGDIEVYKHPRQGTSVRLAKSGDFVRFSVVETPRRDDGV